MACSGLRSKKQKKNNSTKMKGKPPTPQPRHRIVEKTHVSLGVRPTTLARYVNAWELQSRISSLPYIRGACTLCTPISFLQKTTNPMLATKKQLETWQNVTFFPPGDRANFSTFWGDLFTKLHKAWRKREESAVVSAVLVAWLPKSPCPSIFRPLESVNPRVQ